MSIAKLILPYRQVALCAAAAFGIAAAYWHYAAAMERLATAFDNLHNCRQLADQISRAQKSPQRASLASWSQDDLGTAVETAAAEAKLSRDRVLRIDPQSPKRVGKTDYMEQATEVEFSALTLRQLVDFLFAVGRRDDQLAIGTLRLRVPHQTADAKGPESWLADVVLTQRIYAPTTPRH